jgi:hypothetical protein
MPDTYLSRESNKSKLQRPHYYLLTPLFVSHVLQASYVYLFLMLHVNLRNTTQPFVNVSFFFHFRRTFSCKGVPRNFLHCWYLAPLFLAPPTRLSNSKQNNTTRTTPALLTFHKSCNCRSLDVLLLFQFSV